MPPAIHPACQIVVQVFDNGTNRGPNGCRFKHEDVHTSYRFLYVGNGNPQSVLLRLIVENRNGDVLIRAVGELDMSSAPSLTAAAEDAIGDGYRLLLLDLSGLSFLDSTGLSALLAIHREAKARDAQAAIIAPSDNALRVLEMLGVEQVLNIHDTIEDAVRHLG
jgi:anti-sigma B factor antagonist